MRSKLYEIKIFELCRKKLELMKQIHMFKKGFVIFLKRAPFSDFIETRLSNYKPFTALAIRIRFPLFWRISFQLGSNLIKQCVSNAYFLVFVNSTFPPSMAFSNISNINQKMSITTKSKTVLEHLNICSYLKYYEIFTG